MNKENPRKKFTQTLERIAEDQQILAKLQLAEENFHPDKPIDDEYKLVIDAVNEAMQASCGIFRFRGFDYQEVNDVDLNTLYLEIQDQRTLLRQMTYQNSILVYTRLKKLLKRYKKLLKNKKKEWTGLASENTNTASVIKKCVNKINRLSSNYNSLELDKLDDYAEHFKSTFGGQPQGREAPLVFENGNSTLYYEVFTPDIIQDTIKKLENGKSSGHDGVFNEMIKASVPHFSIILSKLFNLIYNSKKIPDSWKLASITLVYKEKGSRQDIKNYRPIALTSSMRRVFEMHLVKLLEKFDDKLNLFQNGFRRNRGTLDNLWYIEELLKRYPEAVLIFLDIQTAYDNVDRRILWNRLFRIVGLPVHLIKMLQALFDNNRSFIKLGGRFSSQIDNLRGLLQGSSLSPILFNHFIASLQDLLDKLPKLNLYGIKTNHLMFADDTTLLGLPNQIQPLLDTCSEWSEYVGTAFHVDKSNDVSKNGQEYKLNNKVIPKVQGCKYLGMEVTATGINYTVTLEKRLEKAEKMLRILQCQGNMHLNGWLPDKNITIYKTFIRSQMEYGLALRILPKLNIDKLQDVQNKSLRAILSTGNTTSINGMHRIFNLSRMELRNKELNVNWLLKIKQTPETLAGSLYQQMERIDMKQIPEDSIFSQMKKNSYWSEYQLVNAYTDPIYAIQRRTTGIDKQTRNIIKRKHMDNLETNPTSIASFITAGRTDSIITYPNLSRETRKMFIYWKLGRYLARNTSCKSCQAPITRKHLCYCAQIFDLLHTQFPDIALNSEVSILDQCLKNFTFNERNLLKITILEIALQEVRIKCLF